MKIQSITLDTCVWITYLSNHLENKTVDKLFDLCKQKAIQIWSSSRVMNYDTTEQDENQIYEMKIIFNKLGVKIQGSYFRLADLNGKKGSSFNGDDFFCELNKSEKELKFISIVGDDPIKLPKDNVGNKLPNMIADYDALLHHFLSDIGIFVTYDKKGYFNIDKRNKYKDKLGLIIADPNQAIQIINFH
jgi:hypothetical protein